MILDNLSRALKTQNWLAAGVEFVIVIAGVVIGFQINAWAEGRADRADEREAMAALRAEFADAQRFSRRLLSTRLNTARDLEVAAEIIFADDPARDLTQAECQSLQGSSHFYVGRLSLPTLRRLQSTGRLGIIRDEALAEALNQLLQRREVLDEWIAFEDIQIHLALDYPGAIQLRSVIDADRPDGMAPERTNLASCDLEAIRADQGMLNAISANVDAYDAYLRDGLLPWLEQIDTVGAMLTVSGEPAP